MAVMDEGNTVEGHPELNRRLQEIARRVEMMEAVFRRLTASRARSKSASPHQEERGSS